MASVPAIGVAKFFVKQCDATAHAHKGTRPIKWVGMRPCGDDDICVIGLKKNAASVPPRAIRRPVIASRLVPPPRLFPPSTRCIFRMPQASSKAGRYRHGTRTRLHHFHRTQSARRLRRCTGARLQADRPLAWSRLDERRGRHSRAPRLRLHPAGQRLRLSIGPDSLQRNDTRKVEPHDDRLSFARRRRFDPELEQSGSDLGQRRLVGRAQHSRLSWRYRRRFAHWRRPADGHRVGARRS